MSKLRSTAVVAVAVASSLAFAACSSGQESSGGSGGKTQKKSGTIQIAYLQKQGDQQYFVDEADGAKAMAQQLGDVKITVVNLGLDANKAISALDQAIANGANGVAIVVPDQQIGPQVIDRAKQANIPLIASDDSIKSGTGEVNPFVGFDGHAMGNEVGKKAAELYKSAGWTAADTRIIAAYKQDLSVCGDRVDGAAETFGQGVGSGVPQTVKVGTDNSPTDAQNKVGAVITANRDVKHWVVWGCNDENVTGAVTALQNAGKAPADIIGVGLGAYLSCKDWQAGQNTGNKASLFIDGKEVGASAVKVLVESIRNGAALPPKTIAKTTMVDKDNWKQTGLKCT